DGFDDMIYYRYGVDGDPNHHQIGAYRNTGNGWALADQKFFPPWHISADGKGDLGVRFVDIDHDGFDDMIYYRYGVDGDPNHHQIGAYRNTGNGWALADSKFFPPWHISADGKGDLGVRFIDVNHDGYDDMIYFRWGVDGNPNYHQTGVYLNTKDGWE
ncbi:MAG: FG-GAP-like repeat-containing protein, partial [Spirochaetes bacterium]|nr:FG-GAP-like repeat-containing protein [Spirochaetota bacterium]